LLERPVPLRQGIGKLHQAVTTKSANAQAFFDQGLVYIHSFVWIEAARSFHQAVRLDPSMAMAYVGLSDAYIGLNDVAAAQEAFGKAQSLAGNASKEEQAKLTIRARQIEYLQNSGNLQLYFAYRQAVTDALRGQSERSMAVDLARLCGGRHALGARAGWHRGHHRLLPNSTGVFSGELCRASLSGSYI